MKLSVISIDDKVKVQLFFVYSGLLSIVNENAKLQLKVCQIKCSFSPCTSLWTLGYKQWLYNKTQRLE